MSKIILRNGKPLDVDNIPQSQLDSYIKGQIQEIARYALQRLDIQLLRVLWQVIDEKTTKDQLRRIVARCNHWGTKA